MAESSQIDFPLRRYVTLYNIAIFINIFLPGSVQNLNFRYSESSGYCPLICQVKSQELSYDLDPGLWLVESDHVTWILASDWAAR